MIDLWTCLSKQVEGLIVGEDVASSQNKTGGRSMVGEVLFYKVRQFFFFIFKSKIEYVVQHVIGTMYWPSLFY